MNKTRILIAAGAMATLVALASRIGISGVSDWFWRAGAALPIILFAGFVRLLLQTRAWAIALRADGIDVPQSRLLGIRLASQAAGYLTVLGPAASEPAKLVLLRTQAGMAAAAPATLVETGCYWFTTLLLGLAGTCAGAFLVTDSRVIVAAAAVFGLPLVVLGSRHGFLAWLASATMGSRAPKWLQKAATAELDIRSFRDRHPRPFMEVLALDSLAQLMTVVEVLGALWAMGMWPSLLQVLVIEAASRIVKMLGTWIPARIGADEGGAVASFTLLGLPPAAGLMLAAARRIRDLLWCAVGIAWTAHSGTHEDQSTPISTPAVLWIGEN